jgi:processive 1,2-diacylglycerol beta-glucosyltransferase
LIRNRAAFTHPLRVRGYVRDTLALMKRSSLLVTKPGGLTVAEACAVGVPMVLVRPLPGQERGNTDVLVRQGAAIHVQRDCDVQHAVTDLLHNRDLLYMMGARARTLGRASAAVDIAAAVLNQLGHSAESS